METTLDGADNL